MWHHAKKTAEALERSCIETNIALYQKTNQDLYKGQKQNDTDGTRTHNLCHAPKKPESNALPLGHGAWA